METQTIQTQEVKEKTLISVGDVFETSWGYDQTNYDFIIVVSISPTRKTAMCKLARVSTIRQETQHNVQKPVKEGFGFEFRMKIQKDNNGNELTLRGSYPYCSSEVYRGKPKEECGYRLDSFSKVNEDQEFWETDSRFGH